MATVLPFNRQGETIQAAIQDVKSNVRAFVGKTHPAALIAWFGVGVILLAGVVFTGYHNWNLYHRGATTDFGKALSIVPALALDGSIVILLVLLLTYFKDGLQWGLAVIFNLALFVIVGIHTSLDYSLATGEALSDGMRVYLRWGILASLLLAFAIWEILIHVDPKQRQRMKRAKLEMQAEDDAAQIELDFLTLEVGKRKRELAYEKALMERQHAARMAALDRPEVEEAWDAYEDAEAGAEAGRIRRARPKAPGRQ